MIENIQKFQAFVKTVEYGSFTEAAKALSYSQSSVSKMIADLENIWNVRLLERSRNGLVLTSEGMQILPYVRRLVDEYDRMQEQIRLMNGIQTGIIRIGAFSSVATYWMPNIIRRFQQDYPNIEYEILIGDYSEIERWIAQGRVDCGFSRLPVKAGLEGTLLERDELVVILPEGHSLAAKDKVDPLDLNDEPFMLLEHGGKTEVSELLEEYQVEPNVRFTTWDDYAIMAMVESGLGVGILPRLILQRIPYNIEIRSLSIPAFREIGFVMREQADVSEAVKRFISYLEFRNSGSESQE